MGPNDRRERQRQELREKILGAARELFTELGYDAVTMRKIAEKIEYSPTTIYLHFRDKDELVRELCTLDFLEFAGAFRSLGGVRDPGARLRGIGLAYLRFAEEYPNQYRMMFMAPHPPVAIEDRRIEKGNLEVDAWAFVRGTVADAQEAGLLPRDQNLDALTQVFFGGVHGLAALHIAKANDPWIDWQPLEVVGPLMIDALLRGLRPAGGGEEQP